MHWVHSPFLMQDIKDLNKYIIGILKKMAKNSNIRETEAWKESKMQMISILTRKIQKIKGDHQFKNVDFNDFHLGIHSLVSGFTTSFNFNKRSGQIWWVILSIPRMIETKYAIKCPSACVAYFFCLSSHWDYLCTFYLQQILSMKKWL